MTSSTPSFWKDRFKASGIHLGISLVLAVLAGALVFVCVTAVGRARKMLR